MSEHRKAMKTGGSYRLETEKSIRCYTSCLSEVENEKGKMFCYRQEVKKGEGFTVSAMSEH